MTPVAGASAATDHTETRFQLQETLTLVRGAHTFKLGADLAMAPFASKGLAAN